MEIGDYIKIGIAIAFVGMVAIIKVQYNDIRDLQNEQAVWTDANKKLADRIENQNTQLREGQIKYDQVQADLNVAKGINESLTQQYALLRGTLKSKPVAKTCAAAISELSDTSKQIAKKWNSK